MYICRTLREIACGYCMIHIALNGLQVKHGMEQILAWKWFTWQHSGTAFQLHGLFQMDINEKPGKKLPNDITSRRLVKSICSLTALKLSQAVRVDIGTLHFHLRYVLESQLLNNLISRGFPAGRYQALPLEISHTTKNRT